MNFKKILLNLSPIIPLVLMYLSDYFIENDTVSLIFGFAMIMIAIFLLLLPMFGRKNDDTYR